MTCINLIGGCWEISCLWFFFASRKISRWLERTRLEDQVRKSIVLVVFFWVRALCQSFDMDNCLRRFKDRAIKERKQTLTMSISKLTIYDDKSSSFQNFYPLPAFFFCYSSSAFQKPLSFFSSLLAMEALQLWLAGCTRKTQKVERQCQIAPFPSSFSLLQTSFFPPQWRRDRTFFSLSSSQFFFLSL